MIGSSCLKEQLREITSLPDGTGNDTLNQIIRELEDYNWSSMLNVEIPDSQIITKRKTVSFLKDLTREHEQRMKKRIFH